MNDNVEPPKKKKVSKPKRPPFDFFGITPTFYLNGKDKTVSGIGFICSMILIGSILGIGILYGVNFFLNKNLKIYSSLETVSDAPVIDLQERKFLIALRSLYPENLPYSGMQEKFFSIKYYITVEAPEFEFEENRSEGLIVPCEKVELDLSDVSKSEEDMVGSQCIEFT